MDLKMNAEEIKDSGITWDCKVQNGNVPIISGDEEDLQTATLGVFLIKGTIPLLPDAGVPWTEFLSKQISFGELDYYVRDSLFKVEKETFSPQYNIDKDKLTMSIGKTQGELF